MLTTGGSRLAGVDVADDDDVDVSLLLTTGMLARCWMISDRQGKRGRPSQKWVIAYPMVAVVCLKLEVVRKV